MPGRVAWKDYEGRSRRSPNRKTSNIQPVALSRRNEDDELVYGGGLLPARESLRGLPTASGPGQRTHAVA